VPGPRVKPTIETAGDIAYGGRRRQAVVGALKHLQRQIDEYNAAVDREMRRLEEARARAAAQPFIEYDDTRIYTATDALEAATTWIREHGGTITAALKQTHPDHGGTSSDFQRTMWARYVLRAKKKTQRR